MECPLRRPKTCGDIDTALGFTNGISMDQCDRCWAAGGPYSETGRAVREGIVAETVDIIKAKGLHNYKRHVQLSIMGRFMDPETAAVCAAALKDAPPPEIPTVRWLGMDWIGEPMPKRVVRAAKVATQAFKKALHGRGCGCLKRAKQAVSSISGGRAK